MQGVAHLVSGRAEVSGVDAKPEEANPSSRRWAFEDGGAAFMDGIQPQVPGPLVAESISASWENETSLPVESRQLFTRYEAALEDLTIDGRVKDADCRQSACRISMWFGSGEESARFQQLAVDNLEGTEIRVDAIGEWPSLDGALDVELFIPLEG